MNAPIAKENFSDKADWSEVLGQPVFILDVEGENKFRFRHLNQCHVQETGLDPQQFYGKTPHDVLPGRLADTVVANYEVCRTNREPYTYVENLELNTGERWWRTTLSPVLDQDGEVSQIVGIAVDVTADRVRELDLTARLSEAHQLNDEVRTFAAATAFDVRGPFKTILALLELVKDGFLDLGDEKLSQLELCEHTAMEAMERSIDIVSQANAIKNQSSGEVTFDLGHLCRDILARVDPDERFRVTLPTQTVRTDWAALQMILHCFMSTSVQYAENEISVSVEHANDGFLKFAVCDDGFVSAMGKRSDGEAILAEDSQADYLSEVALATGLVASRDGYVEGVQRNPKGAELCFSIPGSLES